MRTNSKARSAQAVAARMAEAQAERESESRRIARLAQLGVTVVKPAGKGA